jgi:hypothetical protein
MSDETKAYEAELAERKAKAESGYQQRVQELLDPATHEAAAIAANWNALHPDPNQTMTPERRYQLLKHAKMSDEQCAAILRGHGFSKARIRKITGVKISKAVVASRPTPRHGGIAFDPFAIEDNSLTPEELASKFQEIERERKTLFTKEDLEHASRMKGEMTPIPSPVGLLGRLPVAGLKSGEPSSVDDDTHLPPRKLAELFGVPQGALESRLKRWRETAGSGWIENPDRTSRAAKYIYRFGSIRPILTAMKSTGERRTKKNRA